MNITITYSNGGLTNYGKTEKVTITQSHIRYIVKWFGYTRTKKDIKNLNGINFSYKVDVNIPKSTLLSFCYKSSSLIKNATKDFVADGDILDVSVKIPGDKINSRNYLANLKDFQLEIYLLVRQYLPKGFIMPKFLQVKQEVFL